ncbi:Endophilin-A [Folsomia candida]|uniref:Endophilin-A n=1 Tax=Folsomia candida TaxID=158441 RepID=A0A226DMW6_FOLCA|nr:Endophilin-A [Folsomia candida]
MAFSGLRKQINKANQKTDVTCELVEELQLKTREYLQPNPTARAKMAAVKGISKLSGQAKASTYPQPEGVLGECMSTYGRKLGEDSVFAQALIEAGESLKQMADNKYALDDNVKQNFLEPLHHLQTKDLKEVMHHRKKLQGRRLDFDCKKRKQSKEFAVLVTNSIPNHLTLKCNTAGTTPQRSPLPSPGNPKREWEPLFSGNNPPKSDDASPIPSPMKSSGTRTPVVQGPSCQALYDFDPENPGELGFKERDMIQLVSRIDENWCTKDA